MPGSIPDLNGSRDGLSLTARVALLVRLGAIAVCALWALFIISLFTVLALMLVEFRVGHAWGHFLRVYFISLPFFFGILGVVFVAALFSARCKVCGFKMLTNWKNMNFEERSCYEELLTSGKVKPWAGQIFDAVRGNAICCRKCGQEYTLLRTPTCRMPEKNN